MLTHRRLLVLILFALVLRLPVLFSGFWYDENFTIVTSRLPLDRLFAAIQGDVHPPLWYLITWGLTHIGLPPLALRLPSLLASLGALVLLPRVMTSLRLPGPVQTGALLLMAAAPFQIHYGTEARMYALLQLLYLGGAWAVLNRRWALVSLLTLLMAYLHNWGLIYGATLGVLALLQPQQWKKFIPAFGLAALGWLPWALTMFWQMSAIHANYWIMRTTPGLVLYALHELVWSITLATVPGLLGTALWVLVAIWTARRLSAALPLLLLAGLPVLIGVLVSTLYQPLLVFRFLIGCAPFLYMLLASPLAARPVTLPKALVAAIVIVPLAVFAYRQTYSPGSFRGNGGALQSPAAPPAWVAQVRPGDVIVTNTDDPVITFRAWWPAYPVHLLEQCQPPLGSLTPQTRQAIGYGVTPWDALPAGRVWFYYQNAPILGQCDAEQLDRLTAHAPVVWTDPNNNRYVTNAVILIEK